ncbi:MAG: hypothetical protein VYA09_06490 [Candidatus Neomarinimicrobiota bacterium]|nr:hypothetical protein [Candidatus Neomarinimicrobiota bacterium]
MNDPAMIIPILGILTGMIIPLGVFVWLYLDAKNKRATIIEVAKTIDDPSKVEELLDALNDEKKKEPIEYRRGATITFFVGIGLYLLGVTALGSILKGVGLLVATIGVGTIIAGYLFPDDSSGITKAVEEFEKK